MEGGECCAPLQDSDRQEAARNLDRDAHRLGIEKTETSLEIGSNQVPEAGSVDRVSVCEPAGHGIVEANTEEAFCDCLRGCLPPCVVLFAK